MKKIFTIALTAFLLCLICAFVLPTNAEAATVASGTCGANGDNLTWVLDDEGTLTISGTGEMENYSYNGAPWYSHHASIISVVIEDGVTSVGNDAFYYCNRLTSVSISNSVTSIGEWAFCNCSGLTSITIPDSVTSIGKSAFRHCSALESMTLPFVGCSATEDTRLIYIFCVVNRMQAQEISGNVPESLKSVVITGGESIGEDAFYNCSSLTSITIPDSVTNIGAYAFSGCRSLTSITIPDSVTSIGRCAFKDCSSLTGIVIPNSVTSIGDAAFNGCSALESMTLPFVGGSATENTQLKYIFRADKSYSSSSKDVPKSLKSVVITGGESIGDYAFSDCSSLVNITIPDSVTSIGRSAFSGCSSLVSIAIPDSVTSIGYGTFSNTAYYENEANWENGVLYIGNHLIATKPDIVFGSYMIREGTKCIAYSAFSGCDSLTSIVIPNSVTNIGAFAFNDCSSLVSITIPDSVTAIGDYAFQSCDSLTDVRITDIAAWCNILFSTTYSNPMGCAKNMYINGELATEIVIPDSVTSIGASAFYGCSSLTSIEIPNSVTSIGNAAFSGCDSLTSIVIPDSVTSIGGFAFYGCSSLTSITIPDSVTSIGNSLFNRCYSLTNIVIPDSVTSIGDGAFYYCDSLTSIVIPESVTSIGNGAFRNCRSLTSITIPEGVTNIGERTFYECGSLTSIEIPSSVISIGDEAFYYCNSLTSITIPDGVTSIGEKAFYGCNKVKYLKLPSVAIIEQDAFYQEKTGSNWSGYTYPALKKVFISAETVLIKQNAFGNDVEVTDIYYGGTEEQWAAVTILSGNGDLSNTTVHYNATGIACDGEHDWNDGVVNKEATCTEQGEITYTCLCCGETKTEISDILEHPYGDWVCDGEQHKHTCTVCGKEETADHVWNAGEVTKAPTCAEEGEKTYTCTVCGGTKTEPVDKTTDHTYGDWVCDGEQHKHTCTVCGKEETADHVWNAGEVTKAPTCAEEGEKTYTCILCGATKTETISKSHVHGETEIRNEKEATSTEDGYTGDIYCTVCGKKIADGEVIPAKGQAPTEPKPTDPEQSEPLPTEPEATAPTEPITTEPTPTEPMPTEPMPTVPMETTPDTTNPSGSDDQEEPKSGSAVVVIVAVAAVAAVGGGAALVFIKKKKQ